VATLLLLALAVSLQQTAARTVTQEELVGTRRLCATCVKKTIKTSTGAIQGAIPIGYVGSPQTRNGAYYLPRGWQNRELPVMIMLHGSGLSGSYQIGIYRKLADEYKFIIIAPDSHLNMNWYVPSDTTKSFTTDFWHILACYRYVRDLKNVRFNKRKILVAGNSRGGYAAISFATRTTFPTHGMVTHSNWYYYQTGNHKVPIWCSTGTTDPLFPPREMRTHIDYFKQRRPGWDITLKAFYGGHTQYNKGELKASIDWWYDKTGAIGRGPDSGP